MGQLGGEPLLVPQARREPLEQCVEGRGKLRQLVVRLAEMKAAVEVVVAPCRRIVGHARYRQQRLSEDPVRHHRHRAEQDEGKQHRPLERGRGRLVVRIELYAGHDGPDTSAVARDRKRIEPDPLIDAQRALGPAGERRGNSRERCGHARLLERLRPRKHPHRAPDRRPFVRAVGRDQGPVRDLERGNFGRSLCLGERRRAGGEPLAEQEVECRDADHERQRDCADHGEKQACPDTEAEPRTAHRSE